MSLSTTGPENFHTSVFGVFLLQKLLRMIEITFSHLKIKCLHIVNWEFTGFFFSLKEYEVTKISDGSTEQRCTRKNPR